MNRHTSQKITASLTTSLVLALGLVAPALADGTGANVVGNWAIHDHGQGCWGGGNLLSDGTANGGGNCSFKTAAGEEVASLDPVSWAFTDSTDTAVNLCANITGKKGPVFPIGVPVPNCMVVPVGTDTPVNLGSGTFGKVTIH